MTESDRDFARGYAVVVSGDGVADPIMRQAAQLAPESERWWLFGRTEVDRDGWRTDPGRGVWIPPDRETPFVPMRPSDGDTRAASGVAPGPRGGGSSRPVEEQRREAASLSDAELVAALRQAEAWERWCTSPDEWRWRWDRRVMYIGRAIRGGRPTDLRSA